MQIRQTRNRDELAEFFQKDPALYAYNLGDLDAFFFENTGWWVASEGGEILAALLVYTAFDVPILVALTDNPAQGILWSELLPELPDRAYVHFRAGHAHILQRRYRLEDRGVHYKMRWSVPEAAGPIPTGGLRRLTVDDLPAIRSLYASALPTAHLDARTLQLGKTFGWIADKTLVSIATCHVYSTKYSVATIGAVATSPDQRGRGYGTAVTWGLTRDVAPDVACVALNVHAENEGAIHIYRRTGYRKCHAYEEASVCLRGA